MTKLIYEKSQAGRRASEIPRPEGLPAAEVPAELRRAEPPRLPELAEPEVLRHFTELSTRNFGIDTGFYPLGSCTMKYNPRVNERIVALPGFKDLHPLQEEDGAQGALELMWRLQEILAEVTGLDAVSLQPAAGSQGELTGLMLVRAYFDERGDTGRRKVVIPDTAHGTNPASVTMAGYEVTPVATDPRGNIDVDDLREKVTEETAALMLTNPSTLGLFDENIEEITRIFHGAGALMYYDGANLNAVCGISRPGDMGFDIVHINLHKTFSQPHGGGGPGGGPIAVRKTLEPFLPVPAVIRRDDGSFGLDYDRPKTIGKVRAFTGPFGVFVRSYAFIRSYGPRLREMSEVAVLNANYLLARLKDAYDLPFDRHCMHEFVLSARTLKREHGITALDVAKRLMDYGFHPPTIYFPLIVPEALMIEPTETEPKEILDAFCEAMLAIAREAAEEPELLKEAPHDRPVRRLDEVRAAKRAIVKYGFESHPDPDGEPVEPRQLEAQKGA
ncbi:MAG: glycine dehydrogenase subunit 2 [Gaiellaceae bacterium]|nr:glycine dehydrogenase subunit 2 [Gaiellaceae bacterium]MDX6509841.1 glycine dehydrogenase subunit 2 [Gaiellaceae bacterium]